MSKDRRGDLVADLTDAKSLRAVFENAGAFDAIACAAGDVFPAPLEETTDEQWAKSFASKAMGQINLVRTALPFIATNGSFTLVSGILPDEPIAAGVIGGTINQTVEGYVGAPQDLFLSRSRRRNARRPHPLVLRALAVGLREPPGFTNPLFLRAGEGI